MALHPILALGPEEAIMPYRPEKTDEGKTKVVNTQTGRVFAKGTTAEKAQAQMNLLHGVKHGWKPTGKSAVRTTKEAIGGTHKGKSKLPNHTRRGGRR